MITLTSPHATCRSQTVTEDTAEHAQPLTVLAEDETIFRDSVRAVCRGAKSGRSSAKWTSTRRFRGRSSTSSSSSASWASRFPRRYGGAGGTLLSCRAGRRRAVARRPVDRRASSTCRTRSSSTPSCAGATTSISGVSSGAGIGDGRRLRAVGGRLRQRRVRAHHARRGRRRRLRAQRPQALDHQRQRSRPLHRFCDGQSRGRLSRHHRLPRRARHAWLHGRQEGRQARHPRQQHLRADLRGLPRAEVAASSARSARATRSPSKRSTKAASASARR